MSEIRLSQLGVNRELGVAAAVVDFGERIPAREVDGRIELHLQTMGVTGEVKPVTTGFEANYWSKVPRSVGEFQDRQTMVAKTALGWGLEALGAKQSELTRVAVTTSIPGSVDLAERVWREGELCVAACYSSDYKLSEIVKEKYAGEGLCAIVAVEMVTALREPIADIGYGTVFVRGTTDVPALQFFSDRAGVLIFDSKRLKILHQTTHGLLDTNGYLGCEMVLEQEGKEIPGYEGVMLQSEKTVLARVPDPDLQQEVYMDPRRTTEMFITFLNELSQKWEHETAGELEADRADHAMVHHPSITLHRKATKKFGVEELSPWTETHANAPAVTLMMEAVRVIPQLKPGDTIFNLFFGAGTAGAATWYEVQKL